LGDAAGRRAGWRLRQPSKVRARCSRARARRVGDVSEMAALRKGRDARGAECACGGVRAAVRGRGRACPFTEMKRTAGDRRGILFM